MFTLTEKHRLLQVQCVQWYETSSTKYSSYACLSVTKLVMSHCALHPVLRGIPWEEVRQNVLFWGIFLIFLHPWGLLDSLPKSVSLSQLQYWCWLASAVVWLASTSSSSTLTTSGSMLRQSLLIWPRQKMQQQHMFLNPKQAKKGMPRIKDSRLVGMDQSWAGTLGYLCHVAQ